MTRIFISRPIPERGIELLKEKGFDVAVNDAAADRAATEEELIAGVKNTDALLSTLTDKITPTVMDAGKPRLKMIANYAVGFDNVDVPAAREREIMVTNTPGVLTNTVAEHTFALMISLMRRIPEADRFARAGKYRAWGPKLLLGTDLSGKTLGVVGLGRIGARVAEHAVKGFGMKVLYTDLKPNAEFEKEYRAKFFKTLDEMLPESDAVSIHVPLLESTRHLMNAERISKMKKTAYLVNTSRGPVVDEHALAAALADGTIRGAALDVFEFEPEITESLKTLDNVILTPHIASGTEETRQAMSELAAQNIIAGLSGQQPPHWVG